MVVADVVLVEVGAGDEVTVVVVRPVALWDFPEEHDGARRRGRVRRTATRTRMHGTVRASEGPHWGGPLAARRPEAVDLWCDVWCDV
jgi:hypothetical protein